MGLAVEFADHACSQVHQVTDENWKHTSMKSQDIIDSLIAASFCFYLSESIPSLSIPPQCILWYQGLHGYLSNLQICDSLTPSRILLTEALTGYLKPLAVFPEHRVLRTTPISSLSTEAGAMIRFPLISCVDCHYLALRATLPVTSRHVPSQRSCEDTPESVSRG
jgi:hypothetical protein